MRSSEAFRGATAKIGGDVDQEDDVQGQDKTEEKHVCKEKRKFFEMPWMGKIYFYIFLVVYLPEKKYFVIDSLTKECDV